ncbi:MAG TPA: hypothetical protein PKD86_06250, partial [Gemmatales bacterium]|nr:hypothetical protein [Gemmatales bacterium]
MSKARRSMQSLIGLASMLALTWLAYAEPTWRESFEGSKTLWRPGTADAPYRVLNHELTQSSARSGRQSELIRFEAEPGAHVHFYLPLGRVELL